ncbi:probable ATP-dependent RNA helicase DHX58 [Notolabrus celidotus]|uniref:probable ATP-dependent RNA helicase DHX58 n=1 Tax=Notolabrus celidotus TaxID=1203425 RepID=UPI00148FA360|nr:probable ATP-dependent RNA helicase DHX58 [Notolabrus celidotus]
MADFGLYGYQEEVVERAIRGENIIIWLPTGGGKTRAAVYVAKRHLETTRNAKVMVLVSTVHLADQHYEHEFKGPLGSDYTLASVSGEKEEKDFFGKVFEKADVVICTAQLLYNAMTNTEETKHVELSDITLLIIDECHHTNKDHVYNKIMACYVEKKLEGEQRLPQILGLTASPGAGGETILFRAVEHVLQICANLDSAIVSTKNYVPELKEKVPRPKKDYAIVEKRPKDPFGDHLKAMMSQIHEFMSIPPDFNLRQCGTQEYEMDVVMLEKRGVSDNNRRLARCAVHLRKYNDALLINDILQMMDAYCYMEEFYIPIFNSIIDGTETFLVGLYKDNQGELRTLASNPLYENPRMARLENILLKNFGPGLQSKGIIFSKTRHCAGRLNKWVLNNEALQDAGIKAAILTGAGSNINNMTLNEQENTIRSFRQDKLNLLISTSVAEEGLDIPECNLVVRYGLLTNEIAQQQASGRARARDSQYSVIAEEGGPEIRREKTNEFLEELTGKAIAQVQNMSLQEFRSKITELQKIAVNARKVVQSQQTAKRGFHAASRVQLLCRRCFKVVASGSDIRLVENMHHIIVNPDFKQHYKVGEQVFIDRTLGDWEPGCSISCNNGNCNQKWGCEMKYKKIALLPNIAIKNFAMDTPDGRITKKKWKDVTFTPEEFSFKEYCLGNVTDLFD